MLHIQSSSNKQFKSLKALKQRKNRYKQQKYIIEGFRIIEQAIIENRKIDSVYVKSSLSNNEETPKMVEKLLSYGVDVVEIDDHLFEELSDTVTTQGLIAVLEMEHYELDHFTESDTINILILDRIQDPGNLGTMIRTADAAGFNCILLSKGTVDPYNEKVVRSTMGSIFQIPIIQSDDIIKDIQSLFENNIQVIATELGGAVDYDVVNYQAKTAIIIGNEGNGVAAEILEMGTQNVIIPMAGKSESLNASIAAAIVMYEVFRQKRKT